MNGADSSIADPYVQQFVLDSLENVTIKPEMMCLNQSGEGNTANEDAASTTTHTPSSVSTFGDPAEDEVLLRHATPDSVITSQIPHRLPPMSLLHAQISPPPHLLTPPESQGDHYSQPSLHHHQMVPTSIVKSCNIIIPATLPNTPPFSGSPALPPATYHYMEQPHHFHQAQYRQLQPLHHLHTPVEEVTDMLWLSQSTDLQPPRQEPLDLRPQCNGDNIQNWNLTQQHTSVITTPGKRIFHTDYFHHQSSLGYCQPDSQLQALSPLLTNCSNSSSAASLTSSLSSTAKSLVHNGLDSQTAKTGTRNSSKARARAAAIVGKVQVGASINATNELAPSDKKKSHNPIVDIDDEQLLKISVRDLNVKLKGTAKDKQTITKQRRRTLKNRIYAQNCRNKRNVQKTELEIAKQHLEIDLMNEQMRSSSLRKEVITMQNEVARLQNELARLQNELARMQNEIVKKDQVILSLKTGTNRLHTSISEIYATI